MKPSDYFKKMGHWAIPYPVNPDIESRIMALLKVIEKSNVVNTNRRKFSVEDRKLILSTALLLKGEWDE